MFDAADFVIVGYSHPEGGVVVLASTSLTRADLRYEAETRYYPQLQRTVVTSKRHTLTAEMRSYAMVRAADYAAAFRQLFETWTPPEPAQKRIADDRPALPGVSG